MNAKSEFIPLIAKYLVTIAGLTLVCFLVFNGIFISSVENKGKVNMSNMTLEYLITKYGDHDFKIKSTNDNVDTSGQKVNSSQKGYNMEVTTSLLPEDQTFTVRAIGESAEGAIPHHENLVELLLCNKEIDNFAEQGFKATLNCKIDSTKIPKNLGHVPEIKELNEFEAITSFNLLLNDPENEELSESDAGSGFIRDFTYKLLDYYKIEGLFEYAVEYQAKGITKTFAISVKENTIEVRALTDELLFYFKKAAPEQSGQEDDHGSDSSQNASNTP